jgi:hypothetical protein
MGQGVHEEDLSLSGYIEYKPWKKSLTPRKQIKKLIYPDVNPSTIYDLEVPRETGRSVEKDLLSPDTQGMVLTLPRAGTVPLLLPVVNLFSPVVPSALFGNVLNISRI